MKMKLSDIAPARNWRVNRREPYTEIGIRRLKCIRCGEGPAVFQWQICSDGNKYRPLCAACDIALNRMVLTWMRHPQATQLADEYENSKTGPNVEVGG
jgi:hypothetical protein